MFFIKMEGYNLIELLNQEIKEFRAKYNKNCEIIIGKETLKKLLEFYSDEFQLPDLKNSFIVKYQGVNIKQRNFDYGYYLVEEEV